MGKQSTLGKFWGKPAATTDSAKTDGETKEEDKNDKATPEPSQEVKSQVAEKPVSSNSVEVDKKVSSTSELSGYSAIHPSQLKICLKIN